MKIPSFIRIQAYILIMLETTTTATATATSTSSTTTTTTNKATGTTTTTTIATATTTTTIECNMPGNISHGIVSAPNRTFQANATYSCMEGYNLSGVSNRSCKADGNWSGDEPTCAIVECSMPGNISHGIVSAPIRTFQANATYSCKEGYNLSGVSNRSCKADGNWSGDEPTCTIVECSMPGDISHGIVSAPIRTFQAVATYSCKEGYNLSGVSNRTCKADGNWSGDEPTCSIIKLKINASCIFGGQCTTINAICNDTCMCKKEDFYLETNDTCVPRPPLPVQPPTIQHGSRDTISVYWQSICENCIFKATIHPSNQNNLFVFSSKLNERFITINRLDSGTLYTLTFTVYLNDIWNEYHNTFLKYTYPDELSVDEWGTENPTDSTLTVFVHPEHRCEKYEISISPKPEEGNESNVIYWTDQFPMKTTFKNLNASTSYTFSIKVIAGNNVNNQTTALSGIYTKPSKLTETILFERRNSSLKIEVVYDGGSKNMIIYKVQQKEEIEGSVCEEKTANVEFISNTIFTISGLPTGTNNIFFIYSCLNGTSSDLPYVVSYYTKPQTPTNIVNISQSETELTVQWTVAFYIPNEVLVLDLETDNGTIQKTTNITIDKNGTKHFADLKAGTRYTVFAYVILEINNEDGNSTNVDQLFSEWNLTQVFYTRPAKPNIFITYHNETSLIFMANSSSFFNQVLVQSNDFEDKHITISDDGEGIITNLTMGTCYNITFSSMISGLRSSNSIKLDDVCTRPGPPLYPRFEEIHERSLTIEWSKPENGNVDKYCLQLTNETTVIQGSICQDALHTTYTFKNLTAGTLYTVYITTSWKDLICLGNASNSTHTRPTAPASLSLISIERNSITLNSTDKKWNTFFIEYSTSDEDMIYNKTLSQFPVQLDKLQNGTLYNISVYSKIGDVYSESTKNISTYTKPGDVQTITATVLNSSSFEVSWDTKYVGHYDMFSINRTCRSPNYDTAMIPHKTFNETTSSTILSGLDPGTFCNISIVSIIHNAEDLGDLYGNKVPYEIKFSTKESAPEETVFTEKKTSQRGITFKWKTSKPNGIVRKYKTLIIDDLKNCTKAIIVYNVNTTYSNDAIEEENYCSKEMKGPSLCESPVNSKKINLQMEQNTTGLHPYRNYTLAVQAFTKCWGPAHQTERPVETLIDIPSQHSFTVNLTYINDSSIELFWNPLDPYEEGNGPIKYYTLKKKYFDSNCSDLQTSHLKNVTESNDSNITNFKFSSLRSYWDYNFTISASTEAGEGPPFELPTFTTDQSRPGIIDEQSLTNETFTSSAFFRWSPPCHTNGIIMNYSIEVNDTNSNKQQTVFSESNYTTVPNLMPYSNYTVSVRAYTIEGYGEYSKQRHFRTEIDKPKKPLNIQTKQNGSSEIIVSWTTPELYTGPTRYTVDAVDNVTGIKMHPCETGWDFNATSCTVNGLDAFWNYTFYVTAETIKGTTESDNVSSSTAESTPGNVTKLNLKAVENVTLPRTLTVSWEKPIERDLNGILTHYYIIGNNTSEGEMYEYETDSNATSYVMTDILPGEYVVEVFAATETGNGSRVFKNSFVKSGAILITKTETGNDLLIQPSNIKPNDNERQIVVKLPLRDFLCVAKYGRLTRWGVIVAQDENANDAPFIGSVGNFSNRGYKTWFQVKDKDSIPPYIATYRNWNSHCQSVYLVSGTRRKRELMENTNEPEYADFIVGENGTCSNTQGSDYCNGDLQPGRKYRVKTFACTKEGCTETMYSKALSTDPDLTVPIAAGISSALLVIAIVFVVVFILRRKHLACFAKDDESLHTHIPGEGIHLDKIEHTKKNHFSPPGQGPIKLNDFPDAVEKFHKDSDLIFADAYKMLKEKSPNHPMTAAEQQCCRPKNRYTNILPFDHSRVKLRPSDDMEGSDYINANYIPGYTSRREYIATQGPMLATIDDFWRMVWEQNVDTIVMLTKLMEKGRHKCDKYWPDLGEPVFYGDLVVSLQSESNLSDYTIKIFEIKMKEERKMVRHFSYLKWPDMGCPETPELLLEFVKAVKQYGNREKKTLTGPMIVHCSAGVGRTGTFIAVDYLLQHIRDHDEVDIYNLVLEMRNHRLNMVQTEDQYIYIHECLKAFITTDEEEEDEEEAVYVNTGFGAEEESIYVNT